MALQRLAVLLCCIAHVAAASACNKDEDNECHLAQYREDESPEDETSLMQTKMAVNRNDELIPGGGMVKGATKAAGGAVSSVEKTATKTVKNAATSAACPAVEKIVKAALDKVKDSKKIAEDIWKCHSKVEEILSPKHLNKSKLLYDLDGEGTENVLGGVVIASGVAAGHCPASIDLAVNIMQSAEKAEKDEDPLKEFIKLGKECKNIEDALKTCIDSMKSIFAVVKDKLDDIFKLVHIPPAKQDPKSKEASGVLDHILDKMCSAAGQAGAAAGQAQKLEKLEEKEAAKGKILP